MPRPHRRTSPDRARLPVSPGSPPIDLPDDITPRSRALQSTVTLSIRRPAGAVFDVISDPRYDHFWNELVSDVHLLDKPPLDVGTRYRMVNNGVTYTGVIVSMRRPERIVFALDSRHVRFAAAFDLRAVEDGTLVTCSTHFEPRTLASRISMPVVRAKLPRDMARQLDGFRRFCESYTL